jgi:hypothetical protein
MLVTVGSAPLVAWFYNEPRPDLDHSRIRNLNPVHEDSIIQLRSDSQPGRCALLRWS